MLPVRPNVVFRGASTIGSRIAPSVHDPPRATRTFLENLTGYFRCKRCQVCSLNSCKNRKICSFQSTATNKTFEVEPFITCSTKGVIYLIQCPCGLQYIGRTKRALSVRLNEHIAKIRAGFDKHSVSRHFDLKHNRDPSNTLFVGIDKYRPHWRGSNLVREISRQEMAWIHMVKTYTPFGLNIDTDINAFINNS